MNFIYIQCITTLTYAIEKNNKNRYKTKKKSTSLLTNHHLKRDKGGKTLFSWEKQNTQKGKLLYPLFQVTLDPLHMKGEPY